MIAEAKDPVMETLMIEISLDEDGDYISELIGHPGVTGWGDTPRNALYDMCEIIAEFGLDLEGRDYPPSLWTRIKWRLGLA